MSEAALRAENERLHHRLRLAEQRDTLLAKIIASTRELTDPEEITRVAATLLGRCLHVNRCAYADVEPDQDTFNLFGDFTEGTHSMVGRYRFAQFGASCLEHMRAGQPFVVSDSETDPRVAEVLPAFRATTIRSVICVPVMKRGRFSAAMALHCNDPREWTDFEVQLTRAVAGRCWESIERTRALRDLQASQDRLSLAQLAGNTGIFDWYIPEDRIIWSPELERLYQVPPGTFEGSFEHWVKRVKPEDYARIDREIARALATQQRDYGYDFRVILPDGSEHWLHGQAHFQYAEDGTPLRMIGINVDIHERRQAEDALIRTEKLAAVGRLAASIAHEINNPLEAVTNLLYLARSGGDADDTRRYLAAADVELRRMAAITSQTLRFHRQSTKPAAITANEVLNAALGIYQGRLAQNGVQVLQHIASVRPVVCYEGEIRQVLANLIGNALDAMPRGGHLYLRGHETSYGPQGQAGLVLTVADTGSGISPQHQRRLFEPFFTTKESNGTGLGLWVSHEIVTRHGGSLRLRSRQGVVQHGTVFTLFLPFDPVVG